MSHFVTKPFKVLGSHATSGRLLNRVQEAGAEGDVELPYPVEKVSAWSHPENAEFMSPEELAGAMEV